MRVLNAASCREIRRRRNELVKEMYMLLQKKNEHEVKLDDDHETFDSEMDIVDK